MDDARSVAWKVVAGLVALFLLASALLWAFARTTPQQENANAAQAAGVTTQQNQSAEGDSNAAQPQSEAAAGATAEGATAQDGEAKVKRIPTPDRPKPKMVKKVPWRVNPATPKRQMLEPWWSIPPSMSNPAKSCTLRPARAATCLVE